MAAGVFGYLAYDMVRQMEELGPPNPDPLGLPDAILYRPTTIVIFDAVKDEVTIVSTVRPANGVKGRSGARSRYRPADRGRRHARHAARQVGRRRPRRPRHRGRLQHAARTLPRDGEAGEGLHRRRRHLPGGAVAALRGAVRPAAVRALPGAEAHQPVAVPLLPRLRRVRAGRLQPRDPGARPRRRGDHPPDRRHAPARRLARGGQGARRRACSPTRRSAPST